MERFSEEEIRKIVMLNSEGKKDCECNVDSWISDCNDPKRCYIPPIGQECKFVSGGCGFLGWSDCTAICD